MSSFLQNIMAVLGVSPYPGQQNWVKMMMKRNPASGEGYYNNLYVKAVTSPGFSGKFYTVPPPTLIPTPTPTAAPTPTQTAKSVFDRVTYYLPTGNKTASGTVPKSGYTAAISPELFNKIPMGSLIKLPNGTTVRVEDKTNPRLKGTLDLFYDNKESAKYPNGMERNVGYEVVGRDTSGLQYNY